MKNPNIQIVGTYRKAHDRISCRCVLDDHQWSPYAYQLSAGQGCPVCGRKKAYDFSQSRKLNNEEFRSKLKDISPNITPIESYINSCTPIECFCLVHKISWKARPNDLLRGHGCPKCGRQVAAVNHSYSHTEFIEKMSLVNKDVEVLGTYVNMHEKIKCRCRNCDTIWYPKCLNLFYAKTGCPTCNESKGEKNIRTYLEETNVIFRSQYKFKDCKNVYSLPYDFAILNSQDEVLGLIEYDGEQHFRPVSFFGGQDRFQDVVTNDSTKNKYAIDNNIPLLRCNYMQTDQQVTEEVADFINTIYK